MAARKQLKAVVADRGQVTIPKRLRDQLGIAPGTVLTFELEGGKLVLTKDPGRDPVGSVYGCLKGLAAYSSTDDYIKEIRGDAE